jgi:hypothetical protein
MRNSHSPKRHRATLTSDEHQEQQGRAAANQNRIQNAEGTRGNTRQPAEQTRRKAPTRAEDASRGSGVPTDAPEKGGSRRQGEVAAATNEEEGLWSPAVGPRHRKTPSGGSTEANSEAAE